MMERNFPILKIDNLQVVPFTEAYLTQKYISWLNDPVVMQYSEHRHYKHTMATGKEYFEKMKEKNHHFLAIEAMSTGVEHIGNIGVSIDSLNSIADMSIIVGEKKAWGTGFASIAWIAVMKELLNNQQIRKVTAGTMSVNKSMLRLINRSGMQIEAIRPKHFLWEGLEVDLVQACIFRDK